jgi:hypothetical protein
LGSMVLCGSSAAKGEPKAVRAAITGGGLS